jgi:hypothetical protein
MIADAQAAARAAYLVRRHLLDRVGVAFERAGLAALVVKGAGLAETVYDKPWHRQMADIDLIVRVADLQPCLAALTLAGAAVSPMPPERRWSYRRMAERAVWFAVGPTRWLLELHTDLDRITPRPIDWPGIFARASEHDSFRPSLRIPCREDHALLVMLHAALSDFAHASASGDLERLWGAGIDAEALVRRAREWRLRLVSYLALEALVRRDPHALPPGMLDALRPASWRLRLARRAKDSVARGPRLGVAWTLRQALFRDDPARWLVGLAGYGAMRGAERLVW